ncbi:MAG: 16S rRNA G966 N2-methylase RsmD [Cyclobacteriaceae bacterium]|jgi:16S rRNA G966 N2-methylase RsmD
MSSRLNRLTSEASIKFVKDNENADVNQLLLGKVPNGIDIKEAADQILSRRKAKDKLPAWHACHQLVFPPPLSLEQSSSEKTAAYKKNLLQGNHLIDLTGGLGVDLITLSSQFQKTTHVEIDPWLSELFAHNAKKLSQNNIVSLNLSAEDFLSQFEGRATFFIDPARRSDDKKKVFLFQDCSPNVIELMEQFRQKGESVLIKAAPMIDITLGIKQLEHVKQVHVLSLNNECKEILFLLDFDFSGTPNIHCINLRQDQVDQFVFDSEKEKIAHVNFSDVKKYLYEPNASIRKAGAFKSIGEYYQLEKIAVNTHLYTSEDLDVDFPGRIFEVIGLVTKKNIKSLFPNEKANVISKNHPMTADQLKNKFGLKDGGDLFLIGFRDQNNKTSLIACQKISTSQTSKRV